MKKGKIINIEWMCDYNYFTDEEFMPIKTKLLKEELTNTAAEGVNTVLGILFLDGFLPIPDKQAFIDHIQELVDHAKSVGIDDFYIVSGHGETFEGLPCKHYFFDNVFRICLNAYRNLYDRLPQHWDTTKDKALLLGGMPDRCNRIGLLARFYDHGMVPSQINHTFFPPWAPNDQEWCKNYMLTNFQHWDEEKYNQFLIDCEKRVDDRYLTCMDWYGNYTREEFDRPWYEVRDTEWVRNPTLIDSKVYEDVLFDVVSEGPNYWGTGNYEFLTEKLWRCILHRRPFILAAWPGQWDYLEYLGYKTFAEYLPIPDYGKIEDDEERMVAVVENTKYLLSHREHDEEIAKDVEFNYNLLMQKNDEQKTMWRHWHDDLGVDWWQLEKLIVNRIGYDDVIMNLPEEYLPDHLYDDSDRGIGHRADNKGNNE
jgi:hypothetical protein